MVLYTKYLWRAPEVGNQAALGEDKTGTGVEEKLFLHHHIYVLMF